MKIRYIITASAMVATYALSADKSNDKRDCLVKAHENAKAVKKGCREGAKQDSSSCIKKSSNDYSAARKLCNELSGVAKPETITDAPAESLVPETDIK